MVSIEHALGLGGDERASTAPSQSMAANFIGLLEDSLGHGVWADPVASELARPLDAILAYLPPEGARVRFFSSSRGCKLFGNPNTDGSFGQVGDWVRVRV